MGIAPASQLRRFAGSPFGIVVDRDTASAGEMLAVVLRAEPRTRMFGSPTYGATTGNVMEYLPDHALLLLSISRYAFGDEPPLRGPLQPDSAADSPADGVAAAANWVVEQSPACRPIAR